MISFRVFFSNLIKHLVDFSLNAVLYIHRIPVFSVIIKGLLKLFNPHKDILMTLEGHKIYVNTIDRMMAVTFWKFSYSESYERRFLKDFLWEGMCVVDVGANLGYHTLQLAKCVGPNGKVYAFEPDPGNYRLLVKNVETNGYHNVIPVQKAVCDKPGSISLFVCEENRGDNRMFNSHDGRKAIEVESVSLDQFLGHIQVPIDL
ncbi:MAG: FkbM family methyltransferase, partial [Candidatus Omnitrophica bacterium]|nr:FkbM family methyltransferase [Candidatus Omnitrophota bacterium]